MTPNVSADQPWPWLSAFGEGDASFFHGRQRDIDALLRCVESSPATVLFGRSGLGKTSLLQAGLFPRLRAQRLLPVLVRLSHDPSGPAPMAQLGERVEAERTAAGLRWHATEPVVPTASDGHSLWLRLHSAPVGLEDDDGRPWQLVLVLDQFEEIFTLAVADLARQRSAFGALGDLIENRIPAGVAARLTGDDDLLDQLDLDAQPYRVILSLREDYLPDLEPWCDFIPRMGQNRYRLIAMDEEQALDAVRLTGGALVDAESADRIVRYVAGRQGAVDTSPMQVEPALLSLVCAGLNAERRKAGLAKLDASNLSERGGRIIDQFYDRAIEGLPGDAVTCVEDTLITPDGIRLSYPLASMLRGGVLSTEIIETLINRRLLRKEPGLGGDRIELVHDRVAAVALRRRQRRAVEAEQRAREVAQEQARLEAERAAAAAEADRERALASAALMRRRRNRLALAFAATAVACAISLMALVHAWMSQREALGELRSSTALRLTVEARRLIQGDWPQGEARGWQMLLAAHALGRNSEIDGQLLAALARSPQLAKVWDAGAPVVRFVADPARARVLVATDDHTLRLWDTSKGRPIGDPWLGHQGRITALALSRDGRRAVSASLDGTVRQWDIARGRAIGEPWKAPVVAALAYTDGDQEVIGGLVALRPLIRWNAADGRELKERISLPRMIGGVAIAQTADGRELLIRGAMGGTRRMDAARWEPIGADLPIGLQGPLALSADGRLAAAERSTDRPVDIWQLDGNGASLRSPVAEPDDPSNRAFVRPGDRIEALAFSPNGALLIGAAADRTLRVWSTTSIDAPQQVWSGHTDGVTGVDFVDGGRLALSAGRDASLRLWHVDPGPDERQVRSLKALALPLLDFRDGRLVVQHVVPTVGLGAWRGPTQAIADWPVDAPRSIARDAGGRRWLVVDTDGRARVWDEGHGWLDLLSIPAGIKSGGLSADGKLAWLLRVAQGTDIKGHRAEVVDLARSEVLGTVDQPVLSQDGKTHKAFAFSPDGRRFAAITAEGQLQLGETSPFRLNGGPLRREAALPKASALDRKQDVDVPTFSPDGALVATACGQDLKDLCLWDAKERKLLGRPWAGHRETITALAFDVTGQQLLSGDARGGLRLWDVAKARQIGDAWPGHAAAIRQIVFSGDGRRVATLDDTAQLRVWPTPASAVQDACALQTANLTERQWAEWVSPRLPYIRPCADLLDAR